MSRNKSAKHSKASLYPLFDIYAKSEESREAFCSRHEIRLHNYNYWWAKYREEKGLHGLSKNKGRSKGKKTSTAIVTSPNLDIQTSTNQSGTFIRMEGLSSGTNNSLTLRTKQGTELIFDRLPPAIYLQELLNLRPNN